MTAQVSLRCNILCKDGYIRERDQTAKLQSIVLRVGMFLVFLVRLFA